MTLPSCPPPLSVDSLPAAPHPAEGEPGGGGGGRELRGVICAIRDAFRKGTRHDTAAALAMLAEAVRGGLPWLRGTLEVLHPGELWHEDLAVFVDKRTR